MRLVPVPFYNRNNKRLLQRKMERISQNHWLQGYLSTWHGRVIKEQIIKHLGELLKRVGELNSKYPGGMEAQKKCLKEGYTIVQKGRTNIKYYVKNYEQALFIL